MIDQNSRPARKIGITDHLWETYEDMAQQMGSDRDALINQALFMFARLNGFIEVRASRAEGVAAAPAPAPSRAAAPAVSGSKGAPPMLQPVGGGASSKAPPRDDTPPPAPPPSRPSRAPAAEERPPANTLDNDPARREVAERVLETAAELERLIKGKSSEPREELDDEPLSDDADDSGMDLAAEDEPMPPEDDEQMSPEDDEPLPEDEPLDEEEPMGGQMMLIMDNADPQPIAKERFVIGRGKHCDLVINSGKVSREHAVIVREGDDFFIEDLGSSNGTWFNKQRIKRRKVEPGDEYFICSERIRLDYQ